MMEALQELVGEGCGFVETEAGSRAGGVVVVVWLDPFEETIDHAHVVVEGFCHSPRTGSWPRRVRRAGQSASTRDCGQES